MTEEWLPNGKFYRMYPEIKHNRTRLNSLKSVSDIPIELLCKYYTRIYTDNDSYFYSNINKDLRENKRNNYLSYIKVLYEGVKLK